ncbi:hypothetical protein D3C80_1615210 [compost metagenome]
MQRPDDGVQLGVCLFRPPYGPFQKLFGSHLPCLDERRLGAEIEFCKFIHRTCSILEFRNSVFERRGNTAHKLVDL